MLEKSCLFAESWNVAWRKKSEGLLLEDLSNEFTIIKNSFRFWAADPFLFEYKEKTYIFAELYDFVLRRGTIGYCIIGENKWVKVIQEDYHLSFPYIFEYDGAIYIMPESNESNELYLYKAVKFPNIWKKQKIIRNNQMLADTVFLDEQMYTGLTFDVRDPYNPKFVYMNMYSFSDDYEIICNDVQRRRPAGKIFKYNNMTIRPAQLSVPEYGKGLLFYECFLPNTDSKRRYEERLISTIMPIDLNYSKEMYLDGMHTYNVSENYEVVDIKTRRFNLLNFVFRLLGKFMK